MVEYFGIEAAPGQTFFRCERQRATLSAPACASMWRQANHDNLESRIGCKRCPIGAEHAGELYANMSALHGTLTCARCHRGAERLIGGMHCVSCYNREREAVLGRNAKGTRPTKLPPLEPRRLWFLSGRALTCLSRPRTTDISELIVSALRDSQDRVRFAFRAPTPRRAQLAFPW
jgi:hypothetical protein